MHFVVMEGDTVNQISRKLGHMHMSENNYWISLSRGRMMFVQGKSNFAHLLNSSLTPDVLNLASESPYMTA